MSETVEPQELTDEEVNILLDILNSSMQTFYDDLTSPSGASAIAAGAFTDDAARLVGKGAGPRSRAPFLLEAITYMSMKVDPPPPDVPDSIVDLTEEAWQRVTNGDFLER